MFEEKDNINEFDLMVKSILDDGQEEVPASVWEGVSEGLDKAAQRKTVIIWWRRAAVSVAAAAAVTVAVIFNIKPQTALVPDAGDSGLIAVVEPQDVQEETFQEAVADVMTTQHQQPAGKIPQTASESIEASEYVAPETPEHIEQQPSAEDKPSMQENDIKEVATPEATEYFPEDWGEEKENTRRGISFIVSGLASTNSTQSQNRIGPMKAPTITMAPKETGISETSTTSAYGLPLSFGAGVKVDLTPRWSIGAGLNYSLLTRQFYGKYIKVNDEGSIEKSTSSDIRNTQHYIGIPINAYYDIVESDRINLYAYAGGTVEKCIADNYNVLNTSIFHQEKIKGVQFSANVGLGVEFMLGRHLGLYIDPSVRYYFDNGQPKSIRTEQPLMLGFELGLRARL